MSSWGTDTSQAIAFRGMDRAITFFHKKIGSKSSKTKKKVVIDMYSSCPAQGSLKLSLVTPPHSAFPQVTTRQDAPATMAAKAMWFETSSTTSCSPSQRPPWPGCPCGACAPWFWKWGDKMLKWWGFYPKSLGAMKIVKPEQDGEFTSWIETSGRLNHKITGFRL